MSLFRLQELTEERSPVNGEVDNSTLPPEPEHWGNAPGLDAGDLWDAPWRALKTVGGGLLYNLDRPGAAVRTFLDKGDLGAAGEAFLDPDKGTSATDLRRKYLFSDFNQGEGFDAGDVVDFVGDVLTGAGTDPLSYVTLGATGVGKATARAGQEAVQALRGGNIARKAAAVGGVTDDVIDSAKSVTRADEFNKVSDNFRRATGKALPEMEELAKKPGFTGLEETLSGRLKAGEEGISFGIPFTSLRTEAKAVNSKLGQAIALATDPLTTPFQYFAENTKVGRTVADWGNKFWNTVRNPSIRDAFGMQAKDVEDLARNESMKIMNKYVQPAYRSLQEADVPSDKWYIVEDIQQTYNPLKEVAEVRTGEGSELLQEQYKKAVEEMASLPQQQRAAIYAASEMMHKASREAMATLRKYAPDSKMLDETILVRPAELEEKLIKLRKQAKDAADKLSDYRMSKQVVGEKNAERQAQAARDAEAYERNVSSGSMDESDTPDWRDDAPAPTRTPDGDVGSPSAVSPPPDQPYPSRPAVEPEPAPFVEKRAARYRKDEALEKAALEPTPETWNAVKEQFFGKKRSVEDTMADRAAMVNNAERLRAATSGRDAWNVLENMNELEVQRTAKLLGIPGTELPVSAQNFASKSNLIKKILLSHDDGYAVWKEAQEKLRNNRKAWARERKMAKIDNVDDTADDVASTVDDAAKAADAPVAGEAAAREGGSDFEGLVNSADDETRAILSADPTLYSRARQIVADAAEDEDQQIANLVKYWTSKGESGDLETRALDWLDAAKKVVDGDETRLSTGWDAVETATDVSPRKAWDDYFIKNGTAGVPREKLSRTEQHVLDIAASLGMDVRFFDGLPVARGYFTKGQGGRHIGLKAGMTPQQIAHTFGHEFTHQAFSRLGKGGAGTMLEAAKGVLGKDYDRLMGEIETAYKNSGKQLTPEKALEEILVDAGGKLFRDDGMKWISEAAKLDPTLYERFIEIIRDMAEKVQSIIQSVPKDKQGGLEVLARRLQDMEVRALKLSKGGSLDDVTDLLPDSSAFAQGEKAAAKKADRLEYLTKRRDETAAKLAEMEEEYAQAVRMANAVPSFSPGALADDADELIVGPGGRLTVQTSPTGMKEKTFAHGPTMGDERLFSKTTGEGVTFTQRQAAEYAKKGGVGTRVTGYATPKDVVNGVQMAKRFIKEGSLSKVAKEEAEAAAKRGQLFDRNPISSFQNYLQGGFYKTIRNSELNRSLANTFNAIPTSLWDASMKLANDAAKAGADGKTTLENIVKMWRADSGMDPLKLLDESTVQTLQSKKLTAQQVADVFKEKGGPLHYQQVDNFLGTNKHALLPNAVAERYAAYRTNSVQRLGDTLSKMMGPVNTFMSYWKPMQVLWPNSQFRNQLGDWFRMIQSGTWDTETVNDYRKLYFGRKKVSGDRSLSKEFANRNFSGWRDVTFDILQDGKPAQLNGEELMQLASRHGVIGTGRMSEVLEESAKHATKGSNVVGRTLETAQEWMVLREDVNRLSAFASRLRQGDSPFEAALRVEEALYNQMRISPAADFLRKTGVAPFVSWTAKNLPAQIEFAIKNPGAMSAMLRGAELLRGTAEDEKVPEAMLPDYLKNKYNIVLNKEVNPKTGRLEYFYTTTSGVIPVSDLQEVIDSNGGTLKELLGPIFKMGIQMYGGEFGEEGTGGKEDVLRTLVGRPYSVPSEGIDSARGVVRSGREMQFKEFAFNLFSPFRVKAVDAEREMDKAEKRLKLQLNEATGQLKGASSRLEQAKLLFGDDPAQLSELQARVEQAQMRVNAVKRRVEREQKELEKARVGLERAQRAP